MAITYVKGLKSVIVTDKYGNNTAIEDSVDFAQASIALRSFLNGETIVWWEGDEKTEIPFHAVRCVRVEPLETAEVTREDPYCGDGGGGCRELFSGEVTVSLHSKQTYGVIGDGNIGLTQDMFLEVEIYGGNYGVAYDPIDGFAWYEGGMAIFMIKMNENGWCLYTPGGGTYQITIRDCGRANTDK